MKTRASIVQHRAFSIAAVFTILSKSLLAEEEKGSTQPAEGLTTIGWVFMIVSLSFVLGLAIWCYRRVLSARDRVDPGPAAKP